MSAPRFVVVGHVNRGKSSVVSTLAADESVRIGDAPGTTRSCREYPMRVAGEVLYVLIDTPGFERARHVLAWLRERETSTADRRALVERFVAEHAGSEAFPQEVALLRPILDGGLILYVVDGSVPFSPAYEAETEILRWTGQPRMALINPIGGDDYQADWRRVLDQYFGLVRVFDPHLAGFEQRIELLRALRELEGGGALDRAIEALREDRRHGSRESAALIADALVDVLTRVERERLPAGVDPEPAKPALRERLFASLRRRELRLRADLRELYLHAGLEVAQTSVEPAPEIEADLFDRGTWSRLGLSRRQLLGAGAASGAAAGAVVDAALGGVSLLAGTAIGSLAGLASSWLAWERLARVAVLGSPVAGIELRCGPVSAPGFAWVVLDRALIFWRTVSARAHARRGTVELSGEPGVVRELEPGLRAPIEAVFRELRAGPGEAALQELRERLARALEPLLED